MATSLSLTRRRMLQVSGFGAVALTVPLPATTMAASRRIAPSHLRRASYLGLEGREFPLADGPSLRLVAVADLTQAASRPSLVDHDEAFVLTFSGPAALVSGIHQLGHPEHGTVALFISPTDRAAGSQRYEAVIDRTVPLPAGLEPEPVEGDGLAAAAAAVAAGTSGPGAPGNPGSGIVAKTRAAAARRIKVAAKATRRPSGGVSTELSFTGVRAQGVELRLLRQGRLYGRGQGLVKGGKASIALARVRRAPKGTYDLVVTVTDRKGGVTTVRRTIKVR